MPAEITVHSGLYDPEMKLADLHIHTDRSDGWLNFDRLQRIISERGLDALAFTDHDDVSTGFAMREQFVKYGLPHEIIPSVEITAKKRNGDDAHVIGLYLEDNVTKNQSVGATVNQIIKQGGFAVIPHPGNKYRDVAGVDFEEIEEIAKDGAPLLIETFNSSMQDLRWYFRARGYGHTNAEARSFYTDHQDILRGQTGGTDAHFRTVGRGLTAYKGELREALVNGRTAVVFRKEWEQVTPLDYWRHNRVILRRGELRRIEEAGIMNDAQEEALAAA